MTVSTMRTRPPTPHRCPMNTHRGRRIIDLLSVLTVLTCSFTVGVYVALILEITHG